MLKKKSGTRKFCAILMGDTRRQKMYQPLAFKVMERFLKTGQGRDVTNELFVEDGEDAVSKIERILGKE